MNTTLSSPLIKKKEKKKSELGIPTLFKKKLILTGVFQKNFAFYQSKGILIRDSEIEVFVQHIGIYRRFRGV